VLHKATNLNDNGKNKYTRVKIQLFSDNKESKELSKWKSKVGKSLNPIWEESFDFQINYEGAIRVELTINDGFKVKDKDFLGKASYVFNRKHQFGEHIELPLKERALGKKKRTCHRNNYLFYPI